MVPPPLADLLPPWDSDDDIGLRLGEHQLDPSAKMDDAIVVLDSEDENVENEDQKKNITSVDIGTLNLVMGAGGSHDQSSHKTRVRLRKKR